ncbi:phage tail protein [Cronobacter sakazakii]|uniref:phage tail protein n=1 Tax=Cronobacter sakazakii TaxID=28141 RepID=UPI0006CF45A2|nr:phage tail protein [Cronobacter sakazakii]EGT4425443.1 phage tail protein [Cronobacter sakazakii]EGT4449000.1 phage tail protein [Cronobacter sakazakii]EGT4467596.1 phage tail protein [Cronobacter sakazakii]EGT4471730.1 phage tail protein [Cronobacter sakazakii]EJG0598667.1 tail fiber protein [Cronobacter sakazakii]
MNSSDIPSRITKAFGVNGLKNAIPVDSSAATDNSGVATFDKGFPPITMQPLSAGGIPPSGKDMNGVLYSATLQQQWQNAGMTYPFSQDFSDAISGYPKGAIVPSSVYTGQWLNLNEANGTPPESSTGASTGWVPINNYGITQITMTTGSVVMSSLQAAKDRIIISGTLTANVNLIFPAWIKSWVVHNNCTGNFTVTCRTASGSGVVVIPGLVSRIFCDGVNISDETYNPNNDMVGMVSAFAANAAPTGWLEANGGLISRVTYARLFSRIGTTFGAGDGSTTFALPDMRGEFVRGWDNGRGVDVGRAFGTWQKGSVVVGDDGVAGVNVASSNSPDKSSLGLDPGGSETYPISIAPGANNQLGNQYFGYSRPRNYALLYCIKF